VTVAEHIQHGAWTARCKDWVIGLQQRGDGWQVTLWHWPLGADRTEVGKQLGFDTAKNAVKWAADLLAVEGITVFLNDGVRIRTLIDVLKFSPAPMAVAA
jgi:hypothetical protein